MTDYISITEAQTDPGAPFTSDLAKQYRDNPIAIAEGSAGAPRVQGIALGGVYLTSFTQDGKNPKGLLGLGKVGLLVADILTTSTAVGGGGIVQISLSANGGASYGGWITLYTEPGGSTAGIHATGKLHLNLVTGGWRVRMLASDGNVLATEGTLTLPAGVNAIQMRKANEDGRFTVYDWFVLGARD